MTIVEIVNWLTAIFYLLVFLIAITAFPWLYLKKKKDLRRLEKHIKEKIEKDIALEPKDIVAFGKALGFGPINSRKPVYNLLLEYNEKNKYEKINDLRKAIEKEEPFDDMPDEVKLSLVRLSALVEETDSDGDKHLLLPVHKTLAKYLELEAERNKFRTRARWGTIIAIVSLLMGAFSFHQSLNSPTLEQIRGIVQEASVAKLKKQNTP